jgi:hypothetical protein
MIDGFLDGVIGFLSSMGNGGIFLEREDLESLGFRVGAFAVDEDGDLVHETYCYKLLLQSIKYFMFKGKRIRKFSKFKFTKFDLERYSIALIILSYSIALINLSYFLHSLIYLNLVLILLMSY